jgi:type II secretory pathway pseudopilin PulG
MKKTSVKFMRQMGFSLAEVLAALIIGAMVLVTVLAVYSRAEHTADAVTRKLDSSRLPREILQRIAEDLDRIISSDFNTRVIISNKFEKGLPTAKITILKTIKDNEDKELIFEEITWQTNYDYEADANSLVLYRSHSGIDLEDKLLEDYPRKEKWERELFVPICTGVTFFRIQVPRGEEFQDDWSDVSLPPGIVATISFAEPYKMLDGTLDVPDAEKIIRTIAIDRTRKIAFVLATKED